MVHFNLEDDYLDYVRSHPEYKVIVYGAGLDARKNLEYIGRIDFFCDKRAKEIEKVEGILCFCPEELVCVPGKMVILICVSKSNVVEEIYSLLSKMPISAEVFNFYENSSFLCFDVSKYAYDVRLKDKLRIHIVSSDDGWILTKFADKLYEELSKLGQDVDISSEEDPMADVNHYIHFERLKKIYNRFVTVRTSMITHVDSVLLRDMIQFQTQNNAVGICMSSHTLNKLSLWGISRDRLCYVNPAQDGDILPGKIVLGITENCYGDWIIQICENLDARFFKLEIRGMYWEEVIEQLRRLGFEVDYNVDFDRKRCEKLICGLDYWISYKNSSGDVDTGVLEAMAAGVKTIALSSEIHSGLQAGLTFSCNNIGDYIKVLKQIEQEKKQIVMAVKDWTWENYAKKHLEIWQYLTHTKPIKELYAHQGEYMDGIFSLLVSDNRV